MEVRAEVVVEVEVEVEVDAEASVTGTVTVVTVVTSAVSGKLSRAQCGRTDTSAFLHVSMAQRFSVVSMR